MNKRVSPIGKADGTTFEILAERVKDVHNATSSVAKGAVNQLLTIRNWAIGCYIVEYEFAFILVKGFYIDTVHQFQKA